MLAKQRRQPMDIVHKVQIKFNQHMQKYKKYFSLPVFKFLRQMQYGILTAKHVHLNKIGSVLNEKTTLKKTTERLSRNLGRKGLADEIMKNHLEVQRHAFSVCKYMIFDLSDITKTYAKKMEGLETVRDGSSHELKLGYWQANIIGISKDGETIIPAYSELYSINHKSEGIDGENGKILKAVNMVEDVIGKGKIHVDDRGGDRRVLIENFIKNARLFIIRQNGNRFLHTGEKKLLLSSISKNVKLKYIMEVTKTKKNGKRKKVTYSCGATKVYFPKEHEGYYETPLWLIVAKRKKGGFAWFLSRLPVNTEKEAVEKTFEGYGLRWKIEEVHRHIKQEYNLEELCLQRYEALKNFNAVFWVAMTMIYKELETLFLEIIEESGVKLLYRNKLSEIMRFIYYKISKAVSWMFRRIKLETRIKYSTPKINNSGFRQLQIEFE